MEYTCQRHRLSFSQESVFSEAQFVPVDSVIGKISILLCFDLIGISPKNKFPESEIHYHFF